jgi:hypothetical protein
MRPRIRLPARRRVEADDHRVVEGHKKAGPLLVPLHRRGTLKGKPLRAFFSDVAVKLIGSDAWVNAKQAPDPEKRGNEGGLGWLTGLEPATPGVTVQCSTIELQPPQGRRIYTIRHTGATLVYSSGERP